MLASWSPSSIAAHFAFCFISCVTVVMLPPLWFILLSVLSPWSRCWSSLCCFVIHYTRRFVIPRHTIGAGYFGFTLVVRVFVRLSVRLFPDDNLSKHQWIFTKLGMCNDIVQIWFGIANGQMSSFVYGVICRDTPIVSFSRR